MRFFLYEFVTGGGLLGEDSPAGGESLRAEGVAMISALAQDFLSLAQAEPSEVHVLRATPAVPDLFAGLVKSQPAHSHQLVVHDVATAAEAESTFSRLAGQCDGTVLIAPETGQCLLKRAQAALAAGGKLLGPSPEFIALTSDKHKTAERLTAFGVSAPEGRLLAAGAPLPADFKYPAVVKPVDGCGSHDVRLIRSAPDALAVSATELPRRLEHYCPGEACSMAVLCGPNYTYPLQLFRQTLSTDGEFRYLGGEYAFDENKENRARRLVKAALKALPPAVGYVGFDLVFGAAADGRGDVVIEVNPRLTTSYLGQRQVFVTNVPHMLLETAAGRWPHGRFSTAKKFAFDIHGNITPL